jgi:hypothetical protein
MLLRENKECLVRAYGTELHHACSLCLSTYQAPCESAMISYLGSVDLVLVVCKQRGATNSRDPLGPSSILLLPKSCSNPDF